MRDHNTNYSKGSTEPARMMTPFLASNVFGSIRSNSTTTFCPSLNVARAFFGGLLDRLDAARAPHLHRRCLPVGALNFVKVHDADDLLGFVAELPCSDALQTWRGPRGGPPGSFRLLVLVSFISIWLTARQATPRPSPPDLPAICPSPAPFPLDGRAERPPQNTPAWPQPVSELDCPECPDNGSTPLP